jgi:DNA-binding NarL/FixJ family response regulator
VTAAATATEPVFDELTAPEHEVIDLIAAGHSIVMLLRHLCLVSKTVRNHVSNIFTKLHVADQAQAIVRAPETGIGRTGGAA